ncbi:hypothetical protein B0T25DRAFT_96990 [Lasiosphaeria hispida]|uniref:Uncharacterized protein n=1 Tax=Lasiosphaeria hispida TaxID=260671 RepID=A0AAJ0HQP3_9PEZI|nr:hypothetical protein B0T25DRAFT_96990 [Lasiosphaeria hispida]
MCYAVQCIAGTVCIIRQKWQYIDLAICTGASPMANARHLQLTSMGSMPCVGSISGVWTQPRKDPQRGLSCLPVNACQSKQVKQRLPHGVRSTHLQQECSTRVASSGSYTYLVWMVLLFTRLGFQFASFAAVSVAVVGHFVPSPPPIFHVQSPNSHRTKIRNLTKSHFHSASDQRTYTNVELLKQQGLRQPSLAAGIPSLLLTNCHFIVHEGLY